MQPSTQASEKLARHLLEGAGGRVTLPRVQVLAALLHARRALAHTEIQAWVAQHCSGTVLDRVTTYRVLDWLTEQQLIHRIPGDDRVFRFSVDKPEGATAGHTAHGHCKCVKCGRVFCMGATSDLQSEIRAALPKGFRTQAIDLSVRGLCSECA